jgi:glycosyltransferase involved in cell wall biosynthesis
MYENIIEMIEKKEFDKALNEVEKIEENKWEKYNLSGLIYFYKNELEKAKTMYEKGLKIEPINSDLLYNYAHILISMGKEIEAWKYLMRIHEKDWAVYDILGDIEFKNRSKASAIKFYKKAYDLNQTEEMAKKLLEKRKAIKKNEKIAFFCLPGLETFIKPIAEELTYEYDVRLIISKEEKEIKEGIEWADIVWLEWANELAVFATNKVPEIANKKVICRLHGYEAFNAIGLKKINWDLIDRMIFVADHVREDAYESCSQIKNVPYTMVYNGINLDKFIFRKRAKGKRICFSGYVNYKKNPMLVVQILEKLLKIDEEYRIDWVGDHQDIRIKKYLNYILKDMGIEDKFIFHDWTNEINSWLEDKNYFLSTSIHEGYGVAIMEAMARGIKPIIHNFYAARGFYPDELIYNSIDEAVKMITEESYHSESYRRFIEDNYCFEEKMNEIEQVLLKKPKIISNLAGSLYDINIFKDPLEYYLKINNNKKYSEKFILNNIQEDFKYLLESYMNSYNNNDVYIKRIIKWLEILDYKNIAYKSDEQIIILINKFLCKNLKKLNVNLKKTNFEIKNKKINKELPEKFIDYIKKRVDDNKLEIFFDFFLIHGSMADNSLTGFSDVDTLVSLNENAFQNEETLKRLKNFFTKMYKFILDNIDPTQHHGFFIITDYMKYYYPEVFMPISTIENSLNIFGYYKDFFKIRDCKYFLAKSTVSMANYFVSVYRNNIQIRNSFDIKRYISRFFMMPVLYYELVENKFLYKRDILLDLKGKRKFPGSYNIYFLSMIREQWDRFNYNKSEYILGNEILKEASDYSEKLLKIISNKKSLFLEGVYDDRAL